MCLIAWDWRPDSKPSLILAANRDEFYKRPSQEAHYWEDKPHIYGGKDLELGGSWLTCSTNGRLATVTNYFSWEGKKDRSISRGEIVAGFVSSDLSAKEYAEQVLEPHKNEYNGFSAVLFDGKTLVCCSNRDPDKFCRELAAGTYTLSNHLLDTPWPKSEKLKRAITEVSREMDHEEISASLLDALRESDMNLEDRSSQKGLLEREKSEIEQVMKSEVFLQSSSYGTRTSTVVTYSDDTGFDFTEKNYDTPCSRSSFSHQVISKNE